MKRIALAVLFIIVCASPNSAFAQHKWSGCYLGLHGAYGWGNGNWQNVEVDTRHSNTDIEGPLVGLSGGCDYQYKAFLIGASAEINAGSLDGTGVFDPALAGATASFESEWFGSVDGRVGVAFDKVLLYAVGGYAWGSFSHSFIFNGAVTDLGSRTHEGFTWGGGAEVALNKNLSVRIEYRHYDFGDDLVPNQSGLVAHTVEFEFDVVKLGLNYKF